MPGLACGASAEPPPVRAERLLVEKGNRKLTVFSKGKAVRTYTVALGTNPLGRKEVQGDGKTPEGKYIIDRRNKWSAFHLALHVSYPNAEDRKRAAALGKPPGGDIMIHGLPNTWKWVGSSHTAYDWTAGCIAVTNEEIEELWRIVPNGTPVEIVP